MDTLLFLIVLAGIGFVIYKNVFVERKNESQSAGRSSQKPQATSSKPERIMNKDNPEHIAFIHKAPAEMQERQAVLTLDGCGNFDLMMWKKNDLVNCEYSLPDQLKQYDEKKLIFRYALPESKQVFGSYWQAPAAIYWEYDGVNNEALIWLFGLFGTRFAISINQSSTGETSVSQVLANEEVNIDLEEDYFFNEYKRRINSYGEDALKSALFPFVTHPYFCDPTPVEFDQLPSETLDFFRYCIKNDLICEETYLDSDISREAIPDIAASLIRGETPEIRRVVTSYEDDDTIVATEFIDAPDEEGTPEANQSGKMPKAKADTTQWVPEGRQTAKITDDIAVDENGNLQTKIADGVVISKDNFSVEIADGLSVHKDGFTTRIAKGIDVHSDGRTTVDVMGSKVTMGEKKKDWKEGFFESDNKKKGFFD